MFAAFLEDDSRARTEPMAASEDAPPSSGDDLAISEGLTRGRSLFVSLDFFSLTLPNSGSAGLGVIVSSSSSRVDSFLLYRVMMLCHGFLA
jgi:hypothetical protein